LKRSIKHFTSYSSLYIVICRYVLLYRTVGEPDFNASSTPRIW